MRKKIIIPAIIVIALVVMFSLASCSAPQSNNQETSSPETKGVSEYLIEEDGEQYLILPISQSKIFVRDRYKQHLDNIDIELLITADETICDKTSTYGDIPGFTLDIDDSGYLCLHAEWIVDIEPPNVVAANNSVMISGCNIDHEHIFFDVRIAK